MYIYIVTNKNFEGYKIGITSNLVNRMSIYNTSSPNDYELHWHKYTVWNREIEELIKKKWEKKLHSQNKEWYKLDEYQCKKVKDFIDIQINLLE